MDLARFLSPRSVAVVGASERRLMSNAAVHQLLPAPVELHLVNPRAAEAYGRPTVPDLTAIGSPVDAVLALVGADAAVEVVAEAAALGCGGVVVVASGFGEAGAAGVALQGRLLGAAGDLCIMGPNCTGFVNTTCGVGLFTGMPVPVAAGGVSIVSQSGYLMRAAMVAADERGLGARLAVSSGNEAVCGLADYIAFLADDPETRVICLVVETVRDATGFFAAVARAHANDKAVIALKLGTSERGRDIMVSHTGALATDAWVYEVGLRQAGVIQARDLEDLLDRAQILARLAPERWRPVHRVALIASSGGVAALASDTVAEEGVDLPALDGLLEPIRARIPGAPHANPLDLTGFAIEPPEVVEDLVEVFTTSGEVDAVVVCWWLGEEDRQRAELLLAPLRNVASRTDVPQIMTTVEASRLGSWTSAEDGRLVTLCRGLRGTARALAALDEHVVHVARVARRRSRSVSRPASPLPRPRPVPSEVGPIVGFADAMTLLAAHGVPVVPWIVTEDAEAAVDLGALGGASDVVVKLADVPHRTELGAVMVGVEPGHVPAAVAALREVAAAHHVPKAVAVQSRAAGTGEAFIGLRRSTDLGPVIVIGLGGVLVELTKRVVGRLLPVDRADVDEMIDELGVFTTGTRGAAPWDRRAFATAVLGVAELGQRAAGWLDSVDINPVICGDAECAAVDALLVMRAD